MRWKNFDIESIDPTKDLSTREVYGLDPAPEVGDVNREKSRTVSIFAIRNFKFLGFCFGKNGKGIYIRVHARMAELLQYSRYEEEHRRSERMAVSPDTHGYMEAVETAQDTKAEAYGTGTAGMGNL